MWPQVVTSAKQRQEPFFWNPLTNYRKWVLDFPSTYLINRTNAFSAGQSWILFSNLSHSWGVKNKDFHVASQTDLLPVLYFFLRCRLFNNMRPVKSQTQPTVTFFASVNYTITKSTCSGFSVRAWSAEPVWEAKVWKLLETKQILVHC